MDGVDSGLGRYPEGYAPIHIGCLRPGTPLSFNLYLSNGVSRPPTLYIPLGLPFTGELKDRIEQRGLRDEIVIEATAARSFASYVGQHLQVLLMSRDLPPQEKSRLIYQTTAYVIEELQAAPTSVGLIDRTKDLAQTVSRYVIANPSIVGQVAPSTPQAYSAPIHAINTLVHGMALAGSTRRLGTKDIRCMGEAFLLHDLGKATVDVRILDKPGPLDAGEWSVVKQHPTQSVELLRRTQGRFDDTVFKMILEHHERLDGTGYPLGLKGEQIGLFARICFITDAYSALTANRPYREAKTPFAALKTIVDEMTDAIDHSLFRNFIMLLGGRSATRVTAMVR